jgi:flagellin
MKDFSKAQQKSMERLSTGYRLQTASDDSGNYQIAVDATRQLRGLETANKNATSAKNIVDIADESLTKMSELAYSIQSLAQKALRGTADERAAYQEEANALLAEIKNLKNETKYNDVQVFRSEGFIFQVGYEGNANSGLTVNTSLDSSELSGFDIDSYSVDFSTDAKIEAEMEKFDALQGDLNKKTVEIGAKNHMLDNVIEAQEKIYTGVNANREDLINTDMAEELVSYIKNQILNSAASALREQTTSLNSALAIGLIVA